MKSTKLRVVPNKSNTVISKPNLNIKSRSSRPIRDDETDYETSQCSTNQCTTNQCSTNQNTANQCKKPLTVIKCDKYKCKKLGQDTESESESESDHEQTEHETKPETEHNTEPETDHYYEQKSEPKLKVKNPKITKITESVQLPPNILDKLNENALEISLLKSVITNNSAEIGLVKSELTKLKNYINYKQNKKLIKNFDNSVVGEPNNDLVSVIIPTHNNFDNLLRAIASVNNQTHKNIEIIVVNNYQNEKINLPSVKVINLPVDYKIKYESNYVNGLLINEGAKEAKGKWIAFLEDNDVWFKEKIEYQLHFMNKYNLLLSSCGFFIGNSPFIANNACEYDKFDHMVDSMEKMDNHLYSLNNKNYKYILNSSLVVDKYLFDKNNGYRFVENDDIDLVNRLMESKNCGIINIALYYHYSCILNN